MVYIVQQGLCHSAVWESWSCLVHESECPCRPNLVLGSQRTPWQLLVFSLCWNPEGVEFNTGHSVWIDEFSSKIESKSFLSPCPFMWAVIVGPRFRGCYLTWSNQENPSQVCPTSVASVDPRRRSEWQSRSAVTLSLRHEQRCGLNLSTGWCRGACEAEEQMQEGTQKPRFGVEYGANDAKVPVVSCRPERQRWCCWLPMPHTCTRTLHRARWALGQMSLVYAAPSLWGFFVFCFGLIFSPIHLNHQIIWGLHWPLISPVPAYTLGLCSFQPSARSVGSLLSRLQDQRFGEFRMDFGTQGCALGCKVDILVPSCGWPWSLPRCLCPDSVGLFLQVSGSFLHHTVH